LPERDRVGSAFVILVIELNAIVLPKAHFADFVRAGWWLGQRQKTATGARIPRLSHNITLPRRWDIRLRECFS